MQNKVTFDVKYYDKHHKATLAKSPVSSKIDTAVSKGFGIEQTEYLVYTLFREQKNLPGFRTYSDLRAKLPSRLAAYEDYFDLTGGTVRSKFIDPNQLDSTHTEASGVGATLSIVSDLFGLTEADWERIPVSTTKDLDFVTSTGTEFLEIEAKGTVDDSTTITSGISNHKRSVDAKKSVQRTKHKNPNCLLGAIASFPNKNGQNAIIRLLDPPVESPTDDPLRYKILARLSYYWRELTVVSSARFLIALANRLQGISLVRDFKVFDNVRLLNLDGEPFTRRPVFVTRSVVGADFAFGEVIPLSTGEFYFYGFESAILDLLMEQSFRSLTTYVSPLAGQSISSYIAVRLLGGDLAKTTSGGHGAKRIGRSNRYELSTSAVFNVTRSGRVLGRVKL